MQMKTLRRRHRWVSGIPYGAALWSLVFAGLGVFWMFGGTGFPFGYLHDPDAALSVFANAQAETTAPVIAGLGLFGTVAAVCMHQRQRSQVARVSLSVFAWAAAIVLAIILPDYRVLVAIAYAPVFLLGAPFHWPPASYLEAVPWPVVYQMFCTVGGLVWAATALVFQRQNRGACVACGRTEANAGGISTTAAQWGKWAVMIAVVIPILYALTRYAWLLGIPLGIPQAFLREGQANGMWLAGASLATVATGGAILTLGLTQHWGEIFPRWMLGLAGRAVPIWLAVVPATLVSIVVFSAGLMYVRRVVQEGIPAEGWGTVGPELLWPLWGIALATGALAYYYRRRDPCRVCGRADEV